METEPYWKKIWYTATLRTPSICKEDVEKVLNLVGSRLLEGLTQYKTFTEESFKNWKEKAECKDNQKLERLIHQLSQALDLDSEKLWVLFCNYLMFEYNGKIEDMANIASYDMYLNNLLDTVWQFYAYERLFLLKTLRYILEKSLTPDNVFGKVYREFITKHTVHKVQKQLLSQMEHVLIEMTSEKQMSSIPIKLWVDKHNREQIEIIMSLIIAIQIEPLEDSELKRFMDIWKNHSFCQLPYQVGINVLDDKMYQVVLAAGNGLSVVMLQHLWGDYKLKAEDGKVIEEIILSSGRDHSVFLLGWALSSFCNKPTHEGDQITSERVIKLVCSTIDGGVFKTFYKILENTSVMECVPGKIIRNSIYKLLRYICEKMENRICIFTTDSVVLLSKLLEDPDMTDKCINDGFVSTLYNNAVKMFPYDFVSFSLIGKNLLLHETTIKTMMYIFLNMKFYTEEYGVSVQTDAASITLNKEYSPNVAQSQALEIPPIIFPAGTQAFVWEFKETNMLTYIAPYSYFSILYEHMHYICYSDYVTAEDVEKVEIGLEIIARILSNKDLQSEVIHKSLEFKKCINLTTTLLNRATHKANKNIPLVKLCFKVFIACINANLEQAIQVMHITNFLPVYTHFELSFEHAIRKDSLTHALLLEFVHEECKFNTHEILLLYLDFFHHCFEANIFYKKVLVPGFTYILSTIFGNHLLWEYKDIEEKYKISLSCLDLIFKVLQQNREEITDKDKISVYEYFENSFKNNHFVIKSFITIVRSSLKDMLVLMQSETNWSTGRYLIIFKIIKICLSLLMIFLQHSERSSGAGKTIVDYCFYGDQKPNIVKIIVGFMNQYFDLSLSKLACRLLRKIAKKYMIPLLAYLEMDHFQVQGMFLQKLRDPLIEDEMKLLIIDLIATCVESGQNGMCAAFFNLTKPKGSKGGSMGDSVTAFMAEHLKSLVQPSAYLNNPLKSSMLELYHTLWTSRKSVLIQDLLEEKHFWPMLADPLFQPLQRNDDSYAKILDVMTLEVAKSQENVDDNLANVIKKIFNSKNTFLNNWNEHVIQLLEDDKGRNYKDEILIGLRSIWSWRNFVMITVKYLPECFEENSVRCSITDICLNGLSNNLICLEDVRVLNTFASLYFCLVNNWGISCYGNVGVRIRLLATIFTRYNHYDDVLLHDYKESLLAIAPKTLIDIKHVAEYCSEAICDFLLPLSQIVQKEYMLLENDIEIKQHMHRENWNTLLMLGITILDNEYAEQFKWWFQSSSILQKVLDSVGNFISSTDTMSSAKVAVYFLIKYAESPLFQDFIYIDYKSFYYKINPPNAVNTKTISFEVTNIYELEEWWQTYTGFLLLNIKLINKLGCLVKDYIFLMTNLHSDILLNILQLPKCTANITALKLVKTSLIFFTTLLKWKAFWKMESDYSYDKFIYAIVQTLNACVLLLLRPKMINGYNLDDKKVVMFSDNVPIDLYVKLMEEIIEIVSSILSCFIEINPPILNILDLYQPANINVLHIENEFLFPNGDDNLSYGTLLYTLHYLCKALNQIYARKSAPQVEKTDSALAIADPTTDKSKTSATSTVHVSNLFIFVSSEVMNAHYLSEKQGPSIKYPDLTGMSAPWLSSLNSTKVVNALEKLCTFLSQQVICSVQLVPNLYQREMLKRKMQGDLQIFHDYIKKRMHDYATYQSGSAREKAHVYQHKRRLEYDSDTSRRTFTRSTSEDRHSMSDPGNYDQDLYLSVLSRILQYSTRPIVNKHSF